MPGTPTRSPARTPPDSATQRFRGIDVQQDRYAFFSEYYDKLADIVRKYQLIYQESDSSVEMYDLKSKKLFLKKTAMPSLKLEDLFIGAIITVVGRQLTVTDFADENTRARFAGQREESLALIKADAFGHLGHIISIIQKESFRIFKLKMFPISKRDSDDFAALSDKPDRLPLAAGSRVVAVVLQGQGAVDKWQHVMGPSNPAVARRTTIDSVRAQYGRDEQRNAVEGSDTVHDAKQEVPFFFSTRRIFPATAQFRDTACCVIKPHAVLSGQAGYIIQKIIDEGFEITAIEMFKLEPENAEEFLEVYKGVVVEFADMVSELTSGNCIALEIKKPGGNSYAAFRELAGPSDAAIAKALRPNTLRALFGIDKIKNAVHCTDLEEDTTLDVEYFFKILQ
eukprot:TRINITY_DN10207_c0_g1_i1.p1 TRINITY_DN10207_c0_g1~~TRINITY_DN10207_c0_g1_i1.p1  ORF type:complete len:396 (+),score=97.31 TRINITY_DN10207_c0_g1_i1:73-1260(+)